MVVDTAALAEASRPLGGSDRVAEVVSGWLGDELVDLGLPPATAEDALDSAMAAPAVADATSRLVVEVALAAGSVGDEAAVVDVARLLQPAVPEITSALSSAAGRAIDESVVAAVVASLDPIVVVPEGAPRPVGPESPVAGRLGVASLLALATMVVTGWAAVAVGADRMLELRRLLTRVAMGALSFAVLLRIGSWVLSPQGGRAPVSEALSVLASAKWTVPLVIGLGAGGGALAVREVRSVVRRRARGAVVKSEQPAPALQAGKALAEP